MEINDKNFEQEVLESDKLVMVDFWASWCMPCMSLKPVIEEIAEEVKDKAKVGFLNIDECPETTKKYSVMSVPAILFFKDGELKETMIGMHPKENYVKVIDELSSQ